MNHEELQKKIESDVAQFLQNGGRISQEPHGATGVKEKKMKQRYNNPKSLTKKQIADIRKAAGDNPTKEIIEALAKKYDRGITTIKVALNYRTYTKKPVL